MIDTLENTKEKLELMRSTAESLKEQYQQVCEEWNDVELALSDLYHYQEFLEFTPEGSVWLESKRKELLKERRNLKNLHTLLSPHIRAIGEVGKTLSDIQQYDPFRYGIRSIRGYNLYHDLPHHVHESSQKFADLTAKDVTVNHIYSVMNTNPHLFERAEVQLEKREGFPEQIVIPPSEAHTEHHSFANYEQREKWEELRGKREETPEERKARLEHELQTSLWIGSKRSKKWEG